MSDCVLQDWVVGLGWKKQTVVMEMTRAPDCSVSVQAKSLITFIRGTILKNADTTTDFMRDAVLPGYKDIEREFERWPLHVAHHVLMALQVIGLQHPDTEIRLAAYSFYRDAVHAQHLETEPDGDYERRMLSGAYGTYKGGRGEP